MKKNVLIKASLIATLSLFSATSLNAGMFDNVKFWDKKDNKNRNNSKRDIVQFIESNGFEVTEDIQDTENLKLLGEKLFVDKKRKMLLVRVTNKTNKSIHVEQDVGYGEAYPKILRPFNTGYLVVSNSPLKPVEKYDVSSYNDNIVKNLTTNEVTYLSKYFNEHTKIFEVADNDMIEYSKEEWIKNKFNEHDFFLVDRVDRVVDDNSFRYGLYVSGFTKVNKHFYKPVTYYFVVYQGKIVKLFFTNEYMNFNDFKKFMYSHK